MKSISKPTRTAAWLIVLAVCLNAAVNHLDVVSDALGYFFGLISPVLIGFLFAFLLSIPVNALEKRLIRPRGKRCLRFQKKAQRPVSILVSIALIVCAFAFVGFAVLLGLVETLRTLAPQMPELLESVKEAVKPYVQGVPKVAQWLDNLSIDGSAIAGLLSHLQEDGAEMAESIFSAAFSVFGRVFSLAMAAVISVSVVCNKERLKAQGTKLLYACFKAKTADRIVGLSQRVGQTFTAFLTGQLLEAVILGGMVFVGMLIFGFPYAPVVGMLVTLMAFIPIIGAWVSAIVGAIMVFSVQGLMRAVWFVLLVIVLQQIEGNLIYPRVMGRRVGLPSVWVLVVFTLGSGLFGLWGMLLSVPVFAVVYQLLRDFAQQRNRAGAERLEP